MRPTATVRILVVDDHPSFRRGVKDILEEGFEGARMSECGNAQEMLNHFYAYTKVRPANEFEISSFSATQKHLALKRRRGSPHSKGRTPIQWKLLRQQIFAKRQNSDPLLAGSQQK